MLLLLDSILYNIVCKSGSKSASIKYIFLIFARNSSTSSVSSSFLDLLISFLIIVIFEPNNSKSVNDSLFLGSTVTLIIKFIIG